MQFIEAIKDSTNDMLIEAIRSLNYESLEYQESIISDFTNFFSLLEVAHLSNSTYSVGSFLFVSSCSFIYFQKFFFSVFLPATTAFLSYDDNLFLVFRKTRCNNNFLLCHGKVGALYCWLLSCGWFRLYVL